MKRLIVATTLLVATSASALPYCINDRVFAIQNPGNSYKNGKKIPWIIFRFNQVAPKKSYKESIEIFHYFNHGNNSIPKLLDLKCRSDHLYFVVGTKELSNEIIFDISKKEAKIAFQNRRKTYFRGRYENLHPGTVISQGVGGEYVFKIQLSEKNEKIHKSSIKTTSSLMVKLFLGSNLQKSWLLWSDSFQETIDSY